MKYPKMKLLISLVLFVFTIMLVSQLEIESNMEDMLPEDSESLLAADNFAQYFEGDDQVVVVIEPKGAINEKKYHEEAKDFIDHLASKLNQVPYIDSLLYKIDAKDMQGYEWAYMDSAVYDKIDLALSNKDMAQIQTIMASLEKELDNQEANYIQNDQQTHYMMIVKPNIDGQNFMESRMVFYEGITSEIDKLLSEYDSINAGITGGAFIQDLEGDEVAFNGLFSTMIITLGLILVIVILFLGGLKLPALSMYPLILGALIAAASAYLIYGSLNMFSISFALLLIGLGIDFAVHLIARYQEERKEGHCLEEATRVSLLSTGSSIVIGAGTTAFAFATFALAKFKAFEQMGIISAIGLVSLCVMMLILVPAIILVFDKKGKQSVKKDRFMWLNKLTIYLIKKPIGLIVLISLLIVVLLSNVLNVEVEGDLTAVYPEDIPSNKWTDILKNEFDYDTNTLTFYADNIEELQRMEEALELREDISRVDSILDYLPTNIDEKLGIVNRLNEALIPTGVDLSTILTLETMTYKDLPEAIKSNYLGKEGKIRAEIIPAVHIYDSEAYEALKKGIIDITNRHPVGLPTIMNEVTLLVQSDMLLISVLCFGVVFLISFIAFKRLKLALLTILPLLLALYCTIGLLPYFGGEINIFSIASFPLIIGIGIDASIHLVHRIIDDETLSIGEKVSRTGKPIILTGLTTMIGFGSLARINHPGMANLGLTVVMGIGINMLLTLVIIPVGMSLFLSKSNEKSMIVDSTLS